MDPKPIKLNDADNAVDFTSILQGHVSQTIKQVFTLKRREIRVHRKLALEAVESIVEDQFGNCYVVFHAKLLDGEVWACADWVGTWRWTNATKQMMLVKEWKRFRRFNDDLLGYFQDKAFVALGRVTAGILKARNAGHQTIGFLPSGLDLPIELQSGEMLAFPAQPKTQPDPTMATKSAPTPANTTAPTSDPVEYGTTKMDQSVRDDREPPMRPTNQGNCCPQMPPIKHGN